MQACLSLCDDHDEDTQETPILLDLPLRPVDQQTPTPPVTSEQLDSLQRLLQQDRNIPAAVTDKLLSYLRERS